MPTVLLQVSAQDSATSTIQRVSGSLGTLNDALSRTGVTATQVLRSQQQMEASFRSLQSAQDRLASVQGSLVSSQQRAANAAQQYQRALDTLAKATGDTSMQQQAVARAFDATITAQDRIVTSTARVADAYRQLATAQGAAQRAQQTYSDMSNAPVRVPAERPAAAGGGGGIGDAMGTFLKYQLGYQIVGAIQGAFTQALQNNQQLSQLAGQTIASTTMRPQDVAAVQQYATGVARSGAQPFAASTVLQGMYGFMSQGFSNQQAQAMNRYAVGLSTIGGMQDTSSAATALLAMGNGFGWGPNVGRSAQTYANYLQAGANIGAYSLPQIASSIPNAGLASLTRLGFDPRFVMSAVASASFSGTSAEETAQNLASLGQVFAHPNRQQRLYAGALGMDIMPGAMTRAGGAYNWFTELQQRTSGMTPAMSQYMMTGLFGNQSAARIISELFAGQGARSFGNVYQYMGQSQQGKGFYQTALGIAGATPGQQLADSEAKLRQQFDDMALKFQPIELAVLTNLGKLADAAGTVADSINKAGGFGQYLQGGLQTLNDLITPGGYGFGNLAKARQQSYYELHPNAPGARTFQQQHPFNPETIPVLGGVAEAARNVGAGVYNLTHPAAAPPSRFALPGAGAPASAWLQAPLAGLPTAAPNALVPPTLPPVPQVAKTLIPSDADITGFGTKLGHAVTTATGMGVDLAARSAASAQGAGAVSSMISTGVQHMAAQVYAVRARQMESMTGRGTTDLDVQNAQARLQLAMTTGQGAGTVQSALGIYRQMVQGDPALSGVQRAAQIATQTDQVRQYVATPLQNAVAAIQNSLQIAQASGAGPAQLRALGDAGYTAQRQYAQATQRGPQLAGTLLGINQQQQLFDLQQTRQAASDAAQAQQTAAQNALSFAQAVGEAPEKIRALGDASFAAQRALITASQVGPARTQALAALSGQQAVFDYQQQRQAASDLAQQQQTAAQNALSFAQAVGESPDKIRALGDAAFAAQRSFIMASQAGPARQQALAALGGQQAIFDFQQARQSAADLAQSHQTAAQNALSFAQAAGEGPQRIRQLGDASFAAQRQFITASQAGPARTQALATLGSQQAIFDFQQQRQAASDLAQQQQIAAQNTLNLAQAMQAPPDQLRALGDAAYAAQRQLILASQSGPARQQALATLSGQQAVFDATTRNEGLRRQQQTMQNQISMAQLGGDPVTQRRLEQSLVAFDRKNAQALGMTPSDVQLVAAQYAHEIRATWLPVPTPFQANQAGINPLAATPEGTAVRFGGGVNPQQQEIATLRRELAAANTRIAVLLGEIAVNTAVGRGAVNSLTAVGGNRNHR